MMTSSNGNIFRVSCHLCGEFTGQRWIPRKKGQRRGALMFSLICVWINGWVNNREAGDLRRYGVHCDVIVMLFLFKRNSSGGNLSVMWYILNCAGQFVMPTDFLRGRDLSTPSVALNAKTYVCIMKPLYIDKGIRRLLFHKVAEAVICHVNKLIQLTCKKPYQHSVMQSYRIFRQNN